MSTDLTTERSDWRSYRRSGDEAARERLIERHVPLVRYFARRLTASLGGDVERDEVVSAGMLGLLDAVEAYDPERGYRFSTYAAPRIRGAMLDELRRRDDAPRSVRRRQRRLVETEERLAVELNRLPRHAEVAAVLGVDAGTLWGWKSDVLRANPVSLEDSVGGGAGGGSRRLRDTVELDAPDAEGRVARQQEVERLHRELEGLEERERLVLRLYDFQEMKLREIAELLEVTESRVSQIRTRAIGRLRDRMADLRERAAA
ncbi:MAG TPA: FliA/WhiG family RNA polymerase sigma factor [Longimicrobiales bacterium]|nr:FliA/WhiG family RNA polymerase sigma factor [Longimicrobiales bacterium]